jgi:excisionase family DNA binding protein
MSQRPVVTNCCLTIVGNTYKAVVRQEEAEMDRDYIDDLIDAIELAQRLKLKLPTIRAWTRLTDMPRIQCGRLVRFQYSAVLEWLRRRGAKQAA